MKTLFLALLLIISSVGLNGQGAAATLVGRAAVPAGSLMLSLRPQLNFAESVEGAIGATLDVPVAADANIYVGGGVALRDEDSAGILTVDDDTVGYAQVGAEYGLAESLALYGDVKVANAEEVKQNWEALKLKEGKSSVLEGVPKSLPAMVKATRIQDKARGVGFDWEHPEQVWEKVQEEMHEFHDAVEKGDTDQIENEFGDILFSLINYARFKDTDPELALERTNKKFIKRFQYLESEAAKAGKKLHDMTLTEMDVYWNAAKKL